MARLSAVELQAARRASGRLGGRPRKPTLAEARAEALERLVPAAIRSLAGHLGDGDPAAWRAALRVFELRFGGPGDAFDADVPPTIDVNAMTHAERRALMARVLQDHPHLAEHVPERARPLG